MALLCAFVPWRQTAPLWDVPSKQLLLDALERLKLLVLKDSPKVCLGARCEQITGGH